MKTLSLQVDCPNCNGTGIKSTPIQEYYTSEGTHNVYVFSIDFSVSFYQCLTYMQPK